MNQRIALAAMISSAILVFSNSWAAKGVPSEVLQEKHKLRICRVVLQENVGSSTGPDSWENRAICSGTLINGDDDEGHLAPATTSLFTLTAAHCDLDQEEKGSDRHRLLVQCPGNHESVVRESVAHPDYLKNPLLSKNDVAVLALKKELPVSPARLATIQSTSRVNRYLHYCAFAGYGEGNDGETGKLNVISTDRATMRIGDGLDQFFTILTAFGEIVPGDSGGPVFCDHQTSVNGDPLVVAVNSYRFAEAVGVSNAVHVHVPWLRAQMARMERARPGQQSIDIENHLAHQERVTLCARQAFLAGLSPQQSAHQIIHHCAYVLNRARHASLDDRDLQRAMMNGWYSGDYQGQLPSMTSMPGELPLEWQALANQLAATMSRSGF